MIYDKDSNNYAVPNDKISTITIPEYVGRVEIWPEVYFSLTKMPNTFHRMMHKLFFGWRYVKYE